MFWAFLAKTGRHQTLLYSGFSGKIEYLRHFEALFQWDNDIVQMQDMAHSIRLMKLYQITMRKKIQFFVSDHLNFMYFERNFESNLEVFLILFSVRIFMCFWVLSKWLWVSF